MPSLMTHDTTQTILLIEKHLRPLFQDKFPINVYPETEHEDRNGEPVACVEVDGSYCLYPRKEEEPHPLKGTVEKTYWCLDILEDASDPSVGLFGCEPVAHSEHVTVNAALVELARLMTAERVQRSLDAEVDDL